MLSTGELNNVQNEIRIFVTAKTDTHDSFVQRKTPQSQSNIIIRTALNKTTCIFGSLTLTAQITSS